MRRAFTAAVAVAIAAVGLAGCSDPPPERVSLNELLATDLGGGTTRNIVNQNAFGLPAKSLPGDDRADFEVGDSFFTQNWVIAPASTTSRDGLGPTFNATACASCHVRDGKASPPTDEQPRAPGLLFRLSVAGEDEHGGPKPLARYGGQLQDNSIPGVPAEGSMEISYRNVAGTFADGERYTLQAPTYSVKDPAFGALGDDVMIGPRIAPAITGMGLLEAVPEATIVTAADPDDDDEDGISGRVNRVWDEVSQKEALGRFGWKANVSSVRQQTAGAFSGDIGVSSPVFGEQDCPSAQTECRAARDGGSPEVDIQTFEAVVFYTRVLAVPAARDIDKPDVQQGARVFRDAGCASCHTPALKTGESDIKALAAQTIHPYTDLLLHDMGPGLADGRPDYGASGSEWRTPPLWGIGLVERINGHTRFLHDGRARSLMEAVLWHGGEGESSRDRVLALSAADRAALISYLESR